VLILLKLLATYILQNLATAVGLAPWLLRCWTPPEQQSEPEKMAKFQMDAEVAL